MDKKKQKEQLRQELLERRSAISNEQYLEKSRLIINRLQQLPEYAKAQTVHCYVSMNERREVNTQPLVKELLKTGKQVVVPVSDLENGRMDHIQLDDFGKLKPNKWGVLEPSDGEEVPIKKMDLVIVPMVGGDRQKNRIGYGKGFYDRFLQQVNCPAVGLLFEQCLLEEIPTEPFDVALDLLITESKFIE